MQSLGSSVTYRLLPDRYDAISYFYMRSKANGNQINLSHQIEKIRKIN